MEKNGTLGEIFICGVPLFLFVSGYLTGKREVKKVGTWYLKKLQRIWIPLFVFVIIHFTILEITKTKDVSFFQWIFCIFNLQGFNYTFWKFQLYGAVPGAGQLWFLTTLMFAYLLVPVMQEIGKIKLKPWQKRFVLPIVLLVQLGAFYLGIQMSYLITFFSGYFLAKRPEKLRGTKNYLFVTLLTVLITAARLVFRKVVDGTRFYDSYVSLISAAVIGVWIFYTVFFLEEKMLKLMRIFNCGVVRFLESISFYVYLTHVMFVCDTFSFLGNIGNKLLRYGVAMLLTFVTAILLWFVVEKIIFKIIGCKKRKKH
jgi:peptidoglycan/LPS O-acetylase OafA/YrhL